MVLRKHSNGIVVLMEVPTVARQDVPVVGEARPRTRPTRGDRRRRAICSMWHGGMTFSRWQDRELVEVCRGGGGREGDNDEDLGDESDFDRSYAGSGYNCCESAPVMADANLVPTAVPRGTGVQFSLPATVRAGAIPLLVPRTCPRTLGPKRLHRVRQPQRA